MRVRCRTLKVLLAARSAAWHSARGAALCTALCTAAWSALFARTADAQAGATTILDRVRINPRRAIDFHAIVLPESVYVGQQATYQVAVLLSADARSRLRRNPEFLPPELRGLLAYELGTPTRVAPRDYGGAVFEAHVFQRALFPVTDGPQVVPAPQLTYSLPQSSSYFSREERFLVRAESASFVVRPLPLTDRPDDFSGAVGTFSASIRIDTMTARVGDPLVFTLRVQGTGNVKLLPRPTIELDWASMVPGTERIQVDSSGTLVRGSKEFDWILTPTRSGRVLIPPQRYSYFDPYQARYEVAESAPLELPVERGTLATVEDGETSNVLPLRGVVDHPPTIEWRGRGLPPRSWWPWLLLVALVPLPAGWMLWRGAKAPTLDGAQPRDGRPGESVYPARGDDRDAIRTTRRTLLSAVADRFGQSPQALVSRTTLARVLRRGGVTRETTRDLLALLEQLDEVGFSRNGDASAPLDVARADRAVGDVLARVEREALPRGRSITTTIKTALLLFAISGALAVPTESAQARPLLIRQGVVTMSRETLSDSARLASAQAARTAYGQRAFGEAEQRFRELARHNPTDADLLVNWGTAAWAAGDTVHAVLAWQRAARLEPFATDVQQRIDLLPSGARGGIADVPMVPVGWLFRLALCLWIAGWALTLWYQRRVIIRQPPWAGWVRGTAMVAIVASITCASVAWWGLRALDGAALAVVTRPETLRIAPGTDADAMGGVTTGDVVRVEATRENWQRVQHADGRRGWLPVARLVALNSDASPSPTH